MDVSYSLLHVLLDLRYWTLNLISIQNNPLHISLFPPGERDPLQFSFMLSSCLDIFEIRMPHKTAEQDFGLLQAIDERLAMYGWLTNTGVKFVVVIDMEGRPATLNETKINSAVGIRDADLKPVSLLYLVSCIYSCSGAEMLIISGLSSFTDCVYQLTQEPIL